MNSIFTKITSFLLLMIMGIGVNFAQTFGLQMTGVSNDGTNYIVSIGMQGSTACHTGSANLQFSTPIGAFDLASATILSHPYSAFFHTPSITSPIAGVGSLNIELLVPGEGLPIVASPGFTEVAQISFPILDAGLIDGTEWQYNGGTTQTVVYNEDEVTQMFATDQACLIGIVSSSAVSNVRISAVDQSLKQITFKNFGDTEQNIADWRLCSNFKYTFGGMDGDAEITVISGDYLLSPDEEMTVMWTPNNGFRPEGDDINVYLPSGGFEDPAAMVDFMQYLSPGNGRESVAVAKGIWGMGDFVTGANPFSFTGTGSDTGVSFWTGFVSAEGCTDPDAANYSPGATIDDGSCLYDITFNVDMNCESGFTTPAVESPDFGWCGGCVPMEDLDADGIYTVIAQLPLGTFEYKYAVDNFASQEDLIDDMNNGGTCAPVTDFFSFANREVTIVAGLELNDTYGTCGICDPTDPNGCTDEIATNFDPDATEDDGSCLYDVTFNVDMNCYDGFDPDIENTTSPGGFTTVALEGPALGWCGSCVTLSDDDLDNIWTVTLNLPVGPYEYKYAHDFFAGQEQLIDDMVDGATCAPVTDFFEYANRIIDVPVELTANDVYGSCGTCPPTADCPTDLNDDGITNGEDFSIFLGNFGLPCSGCPTDFNFDGVTNGNDFSFFLGNFGLDCPPAE